MEVTHHIGWGCDFRHLSEARKPSIELIADCDFGIDYKVPIPIGAVGNIRSCSKAIHNGVQKVVGETQVYPLLFATEHSEVLLRVGFHVDLGELHVALSRLVQNLNTLHTIQAIDHGCASLAVPCQNIVVTIIDNQLKGRSGRQGDPGFTQFYVSFEDELMIRFGSDHYRGMLANLGFTGEQAIQNKMFSKTVESAQTKVEGNNFDIRKQLLNYDDVMNNQREIIYAKRNEILDNESIHDTVCNGYREYISDIVNSHLVETNKLKESDYTEILEACNESLLKKYRLNLSEINGRGAEEVIDIIHENVLKDYEEKLEDIPTEVRDEFEKAISLRVIDNHWMEHISTMSHLRDGIGLRGYANTSPLQAYTMEGYQLFDDMLAKINKDISIFLLKAEIRQNLERKEVAKNIATNDSKDTKKIQKKSTKVGRNDVCPCGSGKKYKQCCGK